MQEQRAGGAVTTGAGAGAAGAGCCPALSLGSAPAAGVVSVGGELEGGSAAGVSGVVGSAVTRVSRGSVVTGASSTGVSLACGGAVGSSTVVGAAAVSGWSWGRTVVVPAALLRLVVLGHVRAVRAGLPARAPRRRLVSGSRGAVDRWQERYRKTYSLRSWSRRCRRRSARRPTGWAGLRGPLGSLPGRS